MNHEDEKRFMSIAIEAIKLMHARIDLFLHMQLCICITRYTSWIVGTAARAGAGTLEGEG
jgi:hypothetical protein